MEEILEKLKQQEVKLDEIYKTVHKIKVYFLTTLIFSFVTVLLPLLGLAFIIPWFLKTMQQTYQGLL